MDRTVTAGGARLLERRISSPSRVLETIHDRLDAVDFAPGDTRITQDVRDTFAQSLIWIAPCPAYRWIAAARAIWPLSEMV